jgi:hypothetical protein
MADSAPAQRPTASQRLAAALGRPAPRPLTDTERREFEAAQDRLDADIARLYRLDNAA